MATKTNTEVNGHKYFRITRTVGHEYKNGKKVPIKKQFLGPSKGAAEKKYKEYLEEQARLKYEKEEYYANVTLEEMAATYAEDVFSVSSKYTPATKERYLRARKQHLSGSWLAGMLLSDVNAKALQKYYNELDATKTGLEALHRFLRLLFKWMVTNGHYPTVLTDIVELPEKPYTKRHEEIVVWEEDELLKLLENADSPRYKFMVHVFAYAGLRIGEIMGLKRTDIRDGMIHINRQCTDGVIKGPKYDSYRVIPMHPEIASRLDEHIAWQDAEMKDEHYSTDFLFTTKTGNMYSRSTLRKSLYRMYDRIGVPQKHPHAFRATFCTQMCRCDVPLEVTSKLLGHKSLDVTAEYYALIKKDTQKDAIAKLEYGCKKVVNENA